MPTPQLLNQEKNLNSTFEKIFAENIRGFLGKKNLTNQKITETIHSDRNYYFPFLNNGITIICEEFKLPYTPQLGNYTIPTKNPVIVNGLQTTYILYEEYLKDKSILDDIYVTIRLYETDDPELVELITDATNTQSVIGFKDKLSNKKFNLYAKELFSNKGIKYITKRGEAFINNDDSLKKSLHNNTILTLWYSAFNESPDIATQSNLIIFKDIFQASNEPKHHLHKLLNGNIDSPFYGQLFFVYMLSELFKQEYKKNQKIVDDHYENNFDFLNSIGDPYVVYLLYKLLDDNLDGDFSKLNNNNIIDSIYELIDIVKPSFNYPIIYVEKDIVINSILNPRIENINIGNQIRNVLQSSEHYAKLFEGIRNIKERSEKISNLYINIDNITLE